MGPICRPLTAMVIPLAEIAMKALSLKQPYAELILQKRKIIETRTWNTSFRGEFLIHASGTLDEAAMKKFGFKDLPQKAIVGKAKLIDTKEYKSQKEWDADADKHCAKELWDGKKRFGFILENIQRITPKPMKGKLNFFEVEW